MYCLYAYIKYACLYMYIGSYHNAICMAAESMNYLYMIYSIYTQHVRIYIIINDCLVDVSNR